MAFSSSPTYQPGQSRTVRFYCEVLFYTEMVQGAASFMEFALVGRNDEKGGKQYLLMPPVNSTSGVISFPSCFKAFERCMIAKTDAATIHKLESSR
jgi:hypothetical protein